MTGGSSKGEVCIWWRHGRCAKIESHHGMMIWCWAEECAFHKEGNGVVMILDEIEIFDGLKGIINRFLYRIRRWNELDW